GTATDLHVLRPHGGHAVRAPLESRLQGWRSPTPRDARRRPGRTAVGLWRRPFHQRLQNRGDDDRRTHTSNTQPGCLQSTSTPEEEANAKSARARIPGALLRVRDGDTRERRRRERYRLHLPGEVWGPDGAV